MRNDTLDRENLISALHKEFYHGKDLLPHVEQSKFISSTGSLNCNLLDVDRSVLLNLREYTEQLQNNLEKESKNDYSKLQSAMYIKLAVRCIDFVLQSQLKK